MDPASELLVGGLVSLVVAVTSSILTSKFTLKNAMKQSENVKKGELKAMSERIEEISKKTKDGEFQSIKENIADVTQKTNEVQNRLNVLMQNKLSFSNEQRHVISAYLKTLIDLMARLASGYKMTARRELKTSEQTLFGIYRSAEVSLLLFINEGAGSNVELISRELNCCMDAIRDIDDEEELREALVSSYDRIYKNWEGMINSFRTIIKSQYEPLQMT